MSRFGLSKAIVSRLRYDGAALGLILALTVLLFRTTLFGNDPWASEGIDRIYALMPELAALIGALLGPTGLLSTPGSIVLIGAGPDRAKNQALAQASADPRVRVADTEASPLHLAALIRQLDFVISSDSLAMHLAIAQGVPTVAFFAPTSAVEIDDFGHVSKVVSTAPDYCSYKKYADTSTITHLQLLNALMSLRERMSSPSRNLTDTRRI